MGSLFYLLLLALTSFVLALVATPLMQWAALRLGIHDHPSARKFHLRPTPLLGGLAISGAVLAVLGTEKVLGQYLLGGALGATLVLLVGLWDDLRKREGIRIPPLSPAMKLCGQIAAASVAVAYGLRTELFGQPVWDTALTLFWIVGITNAFNLLDNMDGLSAGIAAIAAGFFTWLAARSGQYIVAAAAAALCGACIGFLRYNFARPRADIFMGDTGSMFIGFLLAAIAVRLEYGATRGVTPFVPLLILGVPIFDTTLVTILRAWKHQPIAQAGKDHASHRLVALGLTPRKTVLLLYSISLLLGFVAVGLAYGTTAPGVLALTLIVVAAVAFVGGLLLARAPVGEAAP